MYMALNDAAPQTGALHSGESRSRKVIDIISYRGRRNCSYSVGEEALSELSECQQARVRVVSTVDGGVIVDLRPWSGSSVLRGTAESTLSRFMGVGMRFATPSALSGAGD